MSLTERLSRLPQPDTSAAPDTLPLPDPAVNQQPDMQQTPTVEAVPDPDAERRQRAAAVAGPSLVHRAFMAVAHGGVNRALSHSNKTLLTATPKKVPDIDALTGRQKIDPQTGEGVEVEVITRSSSKVPPITIKKTVHLFAKNPKTGNRELNEAYPSMMPIGESMSKGNFRNAAAITKHVEHKMTYAKQTNYGLLAKVSNAALPANLKRDKYVHDRYRQTKQAAYQLAMQAGYPEGNSKNDKFRPASPEVENQDWDAVLEPQNVQALRGRVVETWLANGGDESQIEASISSGGTANLDPEHFAAYLGVDAKALYLQLSSGNAPESEVPKVVPPLVLAKLYYSLLLSDNHGTEIPDPRHTGQTKRYLSRHLAECNGLEMGDTIPPAYDSAPVERMNDIDNPIIPIKTRAASKPRDPEKEKRDLETKNQLRKDTSWDETEKYAAGLYRDDEPGVPYANVTTSDLLEFHGRIEHGEVIRENRLTANDLRNMSPSELEDLQGEASERGRKVVEEQHDQLVSLGIIAPSAQSNPQTRAKTRKAAKAENRESVKPAEDLIEGMLDYVSGAYRRDEPGVAYPTTSVGSITNYLVGAVPRHDTTPGTDTITLPAGDGEIVTISRSLSEEEIKKKLRTELAFAYFDLLAHDTVGIIDKDADYRSGTHVRKTAAQIAAIRMEYTKAREATEAAQKG